MTDRHCISALLVLFVSVGSLLVSCRSDSNGAQTADIPGHSDAGGDLSTDAQQDLSAGDVASDTEQFPGPPTGPVENPDPPPRPRNHLGFTPPERQPDGEIPTEAEIAEFTRTVTGFYKDTAYFDWVFRMTHGLDKGHDPNMMPYKLWWQDEGMRMEGDTLIFDHRNHAENIAKRTVKVLDGAACGYLLTGDKRMAEVAASLMRGMVALALAFDTERDDPQHKYLQARSVFTHDHSYEVDGRKVAVEYGGTHEAKFKWNVHSFEITDNSEYGTVWVNNMRSKDDVPYMFHSLAVATRVWYEAEDEDLREAAKLYIEYMRGFAQSVVDNDWYILTRYEDGLASIQLDTTKGESVPADCGSFVHWEMLFGPDAECNAQLGAALAGYGYPFDRNHCSYGEAGLEFEEVAVAGNWFNHNIYNYFHIAALSTANLWGHDYIAEKLMVGLIRRLERMRTDPDVPNKDHEEFESDSAGWLLAAASQGYPINAREARHIMKWYTESADWYLQWEHWDPWTSMEDGEHLDSFKPPRWVMVDDGQGGERKKYHIRPVEMPYLFEYCNSPLRAEEGVRFIDCDVLADPSRWGE